VWFDLLFGLAASSVLPFSCAADNSSRSIAHLGFACIILCFCFDSSFPTSVPRPNSFSIARWSWPSWKRGVFGSTWDIGQVLLKNFNWLPFIPLWSPYPVLQLVLELVRSLVVLNRFCDPKTIWRKVSSSLWFSMVRISVI
jgi:hypothetical protein